MTKSSLKMSDIVQVLSFSFPFCFFFCGGFFFQLIAYIHDFFKHGKKQNKQIKQQQQQKQKENERKTKLNPAISWQTIDQAWFAKD